VKAGETLYRISRQYGVSVEKVKKWNKLQDNTIEIGQKLIVGQ
jgi:LysM repeat protein